MGTPSCCLPNRLLWFSFCFIPFMGYISTILNIYPNIYPNIFHSCYYMTFHSPTTLHRRFGLRRRNGMLQLGSSACCNLRTSHSSPVLSSWTSPVRSTKTEAGWMAQFFFRIQLIAAPEYHDASSTAFLRALPPSRRNPKAPRWSVIHRILPERILLQVEDAQWFVVELLTMIIRCNDM